MTIHVVNDRRSQMLFTSFFRWIGEAANKMPNGKALALVSGAVVLWASWPSLSTIVSDVPAFFVLGVSALSGFFVMLGCSAVKGRFSEFVSIGIPTLLFVALGLMGNNIFYFYAIQRIGPAEANVTHYLWPVMLVGLAAIIRKRSPTRLQALGILAGFSGVAVALYPQMGSGFDTLGFLFGVCGALTFAIYSVVRSFARVERDVVGPSLGIAGLTILVAHFMLEPTYLPSVTEWFAIVLMGVGPFAVANILWDKATREGATATISSFAFLTPLVSMVLLSVFGLGVVTFATVIGAVLVVLGALSSLRN